eukprot:gene3360-5907_t
MKPIKERTAKRIQQFPEENIWTEYTRLNNENKSVNLGQGFPDFETENFIKENSIEAIKSGPLYYARPKGDLELTKQISNFYGSLLNREIDSLNEVIVSNGASGGIFMIFQAFLNEGDEVIILEPYFNQYLEWVSVAGGKPVICSLESTTNNSTATEKWILNEDNLRKSITNKTKFLIINSPNNPTGKIFTKKELQIIAKISIEFDLLVLTDEVYEFLIFENLKHERLATYENMWERTLTVSSSSKSFSVTGFKVGWIIGPKELISPIFKVNQVSTFCVNTPLQRGIAKCLLDTSSNDYLKKFKIELEKKCNFLCDSLEEIFGKGSVIRPQGGYFIIVDISSIIDLVEFKKSSEIEKDDEMCRWMIKNTGVTFLPLSAFTSNEKTLFDKKKYYCRVCFAKKEETLNEAINRLKKLKK